LNGEATSPWNSACQPESRDDFADSRLREAFGARRIPALLVCEMHKRFEPVQPKAPDLAAPNASRGSIAAPHLAIFSHTGQSAQGARKLLARPSNGFSRDRARKAIRARYLARLGSKQVENQLRQASCSTGGGCRNRAALWRRQTPMRQRQINIMNQRMQDQL
jgi:hypothetical protein